MQLIILFFLFLQSFFLLARETPKNFKKHSIQSNFNSVDPYEINDFFDPNLPTIDQEEVQRKILESTEKTPINFDFTIFPRIITTTPYTLWGLETFVMFGSVNQTYLNFALNKKYKTYELSSAFNLKNKYSLGIDLIYQDLIYYNKVKTLASIKFKQRLLSEVKLSAGILSSGKNIWPIIALQLGKKESPFSYLSDKSFLYLNTYIYTKIHKNAFFKTDFNYSFSHILSNNSLLNTKFKYFYTSQDTPISEQLKRGELGRAYNLFEPTNTQKAFFLSFSYSLIFLSRTYFSLLYEGAFLANSLGEISVNNLQSSYSIELGYVSSSIKNLRYLLYFAIGENENHKIMLGIKS